MIWFFPLLLTLLVNSYISEAGTGKPSISDPLTHFGCKFEPDNGSNGPYQFKLRESSDRKGDHWGKYLKHKEFKTRREFDTFYKKLEEIRMDLIGRYTVDTISPFIRLWEKFNSSPRNKSLQSVYNDFVYTAKRKYNTRTRTYGEIDMVLRVYEKLSTEYPDLKDHFVMGVSDQNVPKSDLKYYTTLEATPLEDARPTKNFQFEHITGVINVLVEGTIGYVLVDPASYTGSCPILMRTMTDQDETRLKYLPRGYTSHDLEVKYKLMNEDNGYVRILNTKLNFDYPDNVVERIDILFIANSLCTFLETVGKSSLLNSYRYMRKTDKEGNTLFSSEVFFYYPVHSLWMRDSTIDVFALRGTRNKNGSIRTFDYTERLSRFVDWKTDIIREVSNPKA